MAATAGKKVRVKLSGAAVAFTNEATTNAGDNKTYQITNAVKRVFDPQLAVVVQRSIDSGVSWGAAVGAYTLNRLTGTIVFAVAIGAPDLIRFASGSYLPMTTIARGKSFTLSTKGVNKEDVVFGDTDITRQQLQRTCSGAIGMWWLDNSFNLVFNALAVVLVEIALADGATPIARAWALFTERSHDVAIAGYQEEPLTWEGSADADNRSFTWLV